MRKGVKRLLKVICGLAILLAVGVLVGILSTATYDSKTFLTDSAGTAAVPSDWTETFRTEVDEARLRQDVTYLASPEMKGRDNGTAESRLAREFLIARLRALGLAPVFGDTFTQKIEVTDHDGTNVAGMIAGQAPNADAVILIAHYDHIGVEDGKTYYGADDNASAVAIALEIARVMKKKAFAPRHHLVFLFPDSEEPPDVRSERMGSVYFADHSPFGYERTRLAVVMDLMGGRPMKRDPDCLFLLGAENSPELATLARAVPQPLRHARIELMSVPMIEAVPFKPWARTSKSDYHAFRLAKRPFLFFTAGSTPHYHTPTDRPDTLAYDKMAASTTFIGDLLARATNDTQTISYFPDSVDENQDLRVTQTIIDRVLEQKEGLSSKAREKLENDKEALAALRENLSETGRLSRFEYRELMLIGLRLQCLMTRPGSRLCTSF